VKSSKDWTPPQNSMTLNVTLNESLAMPCANYIVMGSIINSILIRNTPLLTKSWTNSLLLNIKNNTPTCHLSYILTLTNWRLHFCWPQNPLGKWTYFGKCSHLLKVAWGNLSPSAYDYLSWNTWLLASPILPFSLLVLYMASFPCRHEISAYFIPTCICFNLCLHYIG
jgi:hypothetical protein